jgi:hypothetical protein
VNIAELFVNLGIKGAEKTVGALGSVKKGLGEVSSMSLEAKAGILAAMYGLERMMAVSGAAGTTLTNFASLTGLSSKTLQQWEYAARQAGVSGEELTGSLKAVQNSMTNMLLGKGAPEGLGIVAKAVGFDPKKARDSFYVMEQLQKAAQALPKDVGNNVLKSFGLSEGTISAMRRNAFNPALMAKAPLYSDKEVSSLDKSNIAWSNLGQKIEMAFGHFNAKHGQSLVNDISKVADAVFKMVDAFSKLAEKLKIFSVIGKVFAGWGLIFQGVSSGVDSLLGVGKGGGEYTDKKGNLKKDPVAMLSDLLAQGLESKAASGSISPFVNKYKPEDYMHSGTTTINQNIVHHGDAKDTKAVKDTHRHAVNHAYRQRSAQRRGS